MCMDVLPEYTSVNCVCAVPVEARKGSQRSRTGVVSCCVGADLDYCLSGEVY